ncbi:MAG: hypothetical protein HZB76_02210 [Chlamydiae bacterium]|nr:hypothetical protein [Chlamydiota bacterium]
MVSIIFAPHVCTGAFLKVREISKYPKILEISCSKIENEGTDFSKIRQIFESQQESLIRIKMEVDRDFPYHRDLNFIVFILGLNEVIDSIERKIWDEKRINDLITSLYSEVNFDEIDIMDEEGCYFYQPDILLKRLIEFNKLNLFILNYLRKLNQFYDQEKGRYPVDAFIHFCALLNRNELHLLFDSLFNSSFNEEFVNAIVLDLFHRVPQAENVIKNFNLVKHKWQKSLTQSIFLGLSKKQAGHNLDRLIEDVTLFNVSPDQDKVHFRLQIKLDRLMINSAILSMERFYCFLDPVLRNDLFNQLNEKTHYLLLALLLKNRGDAKVKVDFKKLVLAHSSCIAPLFFPHLTSEEQGWIIRNLLIEADSEDIFVKKRASAMLNSLNVLLTPEEKASFSFALVL